MAYRLLIAKFILSIVVANCNVARFDAECSQTDCMSAPAKSTSLLSKSSNILYGTKPSEALASSQIHDTLKSLNLNDKLAGFLEESATLLGNAGVDITPGVNKTLKTLVEKIQDSILAAIASHHDSTQQTIYSRISEMRHKTNFAKSAHEEAVYNDIEYVKCMRQLVGCESRSEKCQEEQEELNDQANKSCRASEAKSTYRSDESKHLDELPVLECDFKKPASECKFEDFKADLVKWADSKIKTEVATNRSNYEAAHKICFDDTEEFEKKTKECTGLSDTCLGKQLRCSDLETSRDVSMCIFGDKLQEKCESKTKYEELIKQVLGSGSSYSDPDRKYEWASAELIKCMLHDHRMGADFDNATMQKCKPLSNYSRDVGELDLMAETATELNTGIYFDCIQTAMNFSGTGVIENHIENHHSGTGMTSRISFVSPYAPDVDLTLGEPPFAKCSAKADAKTCGLNFVGCPDGWVPTDDADKPCALANCTFADCCM